MVRAVRSKLGKSVAFSAVASTPPGLPLSASEDRIDARDELVEMVDDGVWRELLKRPRRIAEAHQDRRHACILGRAQVDIAVANHDRPRRHPAGLLNHLGEVARVRLRHGEGVTAGNAMEIMLKSELAEELLR